MKIISDIITLSELTQLAQTRFGDMIKGVVDLSKHLLALDAELHADLEAALLQMGSEQRDLWGINLYPELKGDDFLEFDSMINIRPSQNNRSRGVEDEGLQSQIRALVTQRVKL
jgi:hypothetical protein